MSFSSTTPARECSTRPRSSSLGKTCPAFRPAFRGERWAALTPVLPTSSWWPHSAIPQSPSWVHPSSWSSWSASFLELFCAEGAQHPRRDQKQGHPQHVHWLPARGPLQQGRIENVQSLWSGRPAIKQARKCARAKVNFVKAQARTRKRSTAAPLSMQLMTGKVISAATRKQMWTEALLPQLPSQPLPLPPGDYATTKGIFGPRRVGTAGEASAHSRGKGNSCWWNSTFLVCIKGTNLQ